MVESLQETVENTDEQLLRCMATGDRLSFTLLYRRYWEELFITAAKALRSRTEAADVIQDVFLSFWNRREELNLGGSLAAYLHTSVRYKCIHYIEKNITRRDYLLQLAEVEAVQTSVEAEVNLQLKEMQEIVNKAVSAMPPKMQTVYKLSRVEHQSYKEIAENMNISVETVKKHIQNALRLIRTNLPHTFLLIIFSIFR